MTLQQRFGVSERRACRVAGQPRSTQRLPPPQPSDDELALRDFLRDFSRRRPRWGWRRAGGRLRDELLNGHQFENLLEARILTEDWRIDHNVDRRRASASGDGPHLRLRLRERRQ